MQRWLAMAALGAVLLSTPLWGQRGGRGGMPAGGAGHGGFVSHGGGGFSHGPVHVGGSPGSGGHYPSHGYPYHPYYRYPYYAGRYAMGSGYPWGYYGYDAYAYPGWGFGVSVGDSYADEAQSYPAYAYAYPDDSSAYAQNGQIQQDEIDRLNRQVGRLQEQQASRSAPPPQPKPQVHADTVLVFRDKHTEEIQNYALVGNTLWVFTELHARKIPVQNLDVLATTKANEDRGIDFRLPQ